MRSGLSEAFKGAACAIALGVFTPGTAQADPAACIQIDSDLQRLQCYDAVLGRTSGPTLSPEEAYGNLAELLTYSGDLAEVSMLQLDGPYHVQISLKRLKPINGG